MNFNSGVPGNFSSIPTNNNFQLANQNARNGSYGVDARFQKLESKMDKILNEMAQSRR